NAAVNEPENLPLSLPKMDRVLFKTALRAMLDQTKSDYFIDQEGIIHIVPEVAYFDRVLKQRVAGSFERKPLNEALRHLGDRFDMTIVLDERRAGEKAKTPVSVAFKDAPLGTAITQLAEMTDLKVVRMERSLYVTTRENAKILNEAMCEW